MFKNDISEYIFEKYKKEHNAIDWSDLEMALGQYTEKVAADQFRTLLFDISDNLKAYLKKEYSNFHEEAFDVEKFKSQLEDPIADHFVVSRRKILQNFQNHLSSKINIRIINFNYTNTIEDLLDFENMLTWQSKNEQTVELSTIIHIHHVLSDQNIVIGVNDVDQISNKDYHNNQDIRDVFVKPSANMILGSYVEWVSESIIADTDLFVLYGTSVGETDRFWWNKVASRLLKSENSARMIWFVHDKKKTLHADLLYPSVSRDVIPRFARIAGIPNISIETLQKRIFVTLSNKMFSFSPKNSSST